MDFEPSPDIASPVAADICTDFRSEGNEYAINGRKWFSGAGSAACERAIAPAADTAEET